MGAFPSAFATHDGLTLACHHRAPVAAPRGHVVVLHGMGEHGSSLPHRNLAGHLGAAGFAVYGFDWRGHGRSDGRRMHADSWRDLRNDLRAFMDLVQRHAPDGPLFLVGLSLGGLLALNYALHHPLGLRGVVAVAPAVEASGAPAMVRMIVPMLSRVAPRLSLNPGLDLTRISRDAAAVREYTSDPNFQVRTTSRLAAEVMSAMAETCAHAPAFPLPLLTLHGTADTIVPPAGSERFHELVRVADKERRTYPGAYHNLFIELNRTEVFDDMVRWLERHL